MRQLLAALIINCLFAYGVSALFANSAEAKEKTLVIAAFDYKPFVNQDSEGNGYIAEIATTTLHSMKYKTEYRFVPLKRALYLAELGEVDGILAAYYAEERTAYLDYSDPMGDILVNFFTRKDTNISSAKPDDLKSYKVGVLLGTSLIEDLHRDGLETDTASENIYSLKMLLAGRFDLFVGTTEWILYDLRKNFSKAEQNQIVVIDPPYQKQQIYFTMSKRKNHSKKVIEDFNKGLKRLKADGSYKAILDKYGIVQ